VTDGESESGDCDEVTDACRMRCTKRRVQTEWDWRNEEDSWFYRWGDAYLKEQLVICNDEGEDGRAMVTTDDEQVEW